MDHHRVIADFGCERIVGGEDVHRDDDERVVFGDEEAAALEVLDAAFQETDPVFQPGFALRGGGAVGEFLCAAGQAFFPAGEHGIGGRGFLRPAIAGVGLVVAGVHDLVGHHRQAVAVRAVGHHVHVRLQEKHRPAAGGAELQDRLAIIDIVLGEHFIEQMGVAPHPRHLVGVELGIPPGNLGLADQGGQPRQEFGERGIRGLQLRHGLGGGGQAELELIERGVTRLVHPFARGDAAIFHLDLGLEGDARAQFAHIGHRARLGRPAGIPPRRLGRLLGGGFGRGLFHRRDLALEFRLHLGAQARLDLAPQVLVVGCDHYRRRCQDFPQPAFHLAEKPAVKQAE